MAESFVTPGGFIALLLLAPVLGGLLPSGLTVRSMADLTAPGMGLGMAIIRIHCLLNGCCTGHPCALPWCTRYSSHSVVWMRQLGRGLIDWRADATLPVHPLPIYFMAASLAAGGVALFVLRRKRFDGQAFLWFLVIHETLKALLEQLRDPPVPLVQAGSVVLVAFAAGTLLVHSAFAGTASKPVPVSSHLPNVGGR